MINSIIIPLDAEDAKSTQVCILLYFLFSFSTFSIFVSLSFSFLAFPLLVSLNLPVPCDCFHRFFPRNDLTHHLQVSQPGIFRFPIHNCHENNE